MKFLPEGTQGVAVQPIGSAGVLIAATDTIRGISRLDQVRDFKGHVAERDGSEKVRGSRKGGSSSSANCLNRHYVPLVAFVMASAAACTRSEISGCMRWDREKACLERSPLIR